MGKKSKRRQQQQQQQASATTPPPTASAPASHNEHPPSDGPSQEESLSLQTSSASLQRKLDLLAQLVLENNRAAFVKEFVPLDLSAEDANAYLQDLTTAPEAEGQWRNLAAEIASLSAGIGVDKIEGDQVTQATFYFQHPLLPGCNREVTFVCSNNGGDDEWRAEG